MPSRELTAVVYLTAVGAPASYPVAVADRVRHLGRVLGAAGVVGVLATALILAGVATPAAAAPGESIASYDTRIQVSADGRMRIIETIVYDFGANSRHGLIRRIPATFRYDRTHDRVYPIDEVGVTMDGSTVPVERSAGGGYQVLKIGDPGRTVNGKHTYAIGYTVRGGLNSFADHEELYWNVIGGEWDVPIEAGRAEITGPAPVQRVACFAGPVGSRASCAEAVAEGATATVREPRLGEGRALTAVVAFPAGSIANPGPILVDRHDFASAFRATPFTVGGALGLGLLGVAAALAIAWRAGRDRRYVGMLPGLIPDVGQRAVEERKPLIGAPPVSVEFGPPYGLRPAQAGALIDERADIVDVTATIIDLAVRRYLHIRQLPTSKPDWELTKLPKPTRPTTGDGKLRWYEGTLLHALFADGDRVRLSELKRTFAPDIAKVRKQLYADMVDRGWYRRSPVRTRQAARTVAVLLLLASVGVTVLLALFTQAALLGAGLMLGALTLLAVAGKFPARTGKGSAVLARLQGFRLYIATAEAEQIKFHEREQIFSEFLPYAMVFGLAERWAGIFADLATVRPDGSADLSNGGAGGLYWYTGPDDPSLTGFGQSIDSFSTAAGAAIASPTSSAAGSSGFSGSGSSGGGGGGGGGGSW